MAQQTWFVVRGGKETGPYSGTQLKDMAASGKLKPSDQVRRADVETARPASAIKGLFPAPADATVKTAADSGSSQKSSEAPPPPPRIPRKYLLIGGGAFAGLLVMCLVCAGIGNLVGNRGGSGKQTDTKNPSNDASGGGSDPAKTEVDFSKVDYGYDYTKDDYETVPVGAEKKTRKRIIDKGDPILQGKPETAEGYADSTGKFVYHGVSVAWFDVAEKTKLQEEKYLHGKVHGVMVRYSQSGSKVDEIPFVQGRRHGIAKGWFDNGDQEYEEAFIEGNRHGPARFWHKNGKPSIISFYRIGQPHGEYVSFSHKAWMGNDGKTYDPFELKRGRYENGKPVGQWKFGFISDIQRVYHVEVSDSKWTGGTMKEFVGRMQLYMLEKFPNHQLVFDPQSGVANSFADSPEAFFEVFGRPASDTQDIEKSSAPPNLRDKYRKWGYVLKNGSSMQLRVAPTQDGKILIKSGR